MGEFLIYVDEKIIIDYNSLDRSSPTTLTRFMLMSSSDDTVSIVTVHSQTQQQIIIN